VALGIWLVVGVLAELQGRITLQTAQTHRIRHLPQLHGIEVCASARNLLARFTDADYDKIAFNHLPPDTASSHRCRAPMKCRILSSCRAGPYP